jgi:hypothetical protein
MLHSLLFIPLTLAAPVPDRVELPTTPPPVQVLAGMDKDGHVVLVGSVTEYKTFPRQREVAGKVVTENVTVPVVSYRTQLLATKDVQVFDTANKPVDAKKLPDLLKQRVPALVSADGKQVDPLHLRILKEGTLIFVVPGWQARQAPAELPPAPK